MFNKVLFLYNSLQAGGNLTPSYRGPPDRCSDISGWMSQPISDSTLGRYCLDVIFHIYGLHGQCFREPVFDSHAFMLLSGAAIYGFFFL